VIENTNRHKDGHLVVLETSGTPFFDADGTFWGTGESTGRSGRESRRRRNFEERGASAPGADVRGDRPSRRGIAHHLNNLMTVVTGYCELLLTRIPAADSLRPDIEKIRQAGERAADLTKGLLAFSRHQVLQPQIVEINRFLSALLTALQDLSGPSVRVLFSPGNDAGEIQVDPDHLRRTMTHLVANARDAMPGGGEIRLAAAASTGSSRSGGSSRPPAVSFCSPCRTTAAAWTPRPATGSSSHSIP